MERRCFVDRHQFNVSRLGTKVVDEHVVGVSYMQDTTRGAEVKDDRSLGIDHTRETNAINGNAAVAH